MAGPYQRRKIKNPSLKTSSKPRRKKNKSKRVLPQDPVLRKQWNPHWSIVKNYKKLGLCHSVNDKSPPKNKKVSARSPFLVTETGKTVPLDDLAASFHQGVVVAPATVERNAQGDVVSFALVQPTTTTLMNSETQEAVSNVVSAAAPFVIPRTKQAPLPCKRMLGWLDQLRLKHGEDYHAMFMDKALNIYQHTEAQLRAKIRKCKKLLEE